MPWAQSAKFWRGIPKISTFIFLAGVFCLFGSVGLIGSGMRFKAQTPPQLLLTVLVSGGLATAWGFCGTRRALKGYWVLVPLQILATVLMPRLYQGAPDLLS